MRKIIALAALATLGSATAANAVTIVNGSFETVGITVRNTPTTSSFAEIIGTNTTALPGWTVTRVQRVSGAGVDLVKNAWLASDGVYSLDMAARRAGAISQTLTGLRLGGKYTITFDMSGNPFGEPALKGLSLSLGALPAQDYFFTTGANTAANMLWAPQTFSFTATTTTALLKFTSLVDTNSGAALDNVAITGGALPEPSTWALLLTGFGMIGYAARRRKGAVAA